MSLCPDLDESEEQQVEQIANILAQGFMRLRAKDDLIGELSAPDRWPPRAQPQLLITIKRSFTFTMPLPDGAGAISPLQDCGIAGQGPH